MVTAERDQRGCNRAVRKTDQAEAPVMISFEERRRSFKACPRLAEIGNDLVANDLRKGRKASPLAFASLRLLGNPACHYVELPSGPEERPADANGTAIGQVGDTIVSFWLRKNMDRRLS
jgi:hypothetical protein